MIIDNSTGDDLDYAVQDQPVIDGGKSEKGQVFNGQPPVHTVEVEGPLCQVRLTPSKGSALESFTWEANYVPVKATVTFREGSQGERHIEITNAD